jgi:hypothetical protein
MTITKKIKSKYLGGNHARILQAKEPKKVRKEKPKNKNARKKEG